MLYHLKFKMETLDGYQMQGSQLIRRSIYFINNFVVNASIQK